MIIGWIENKIKEKLKKEQHEVVKLEWEKARLEKLIQDKKREKEE